jgi:glycosyltransferase involved in cell wall biosynthesis
MDTIVSQTYKDWELVVFDGASTDRSLDIVKEYAASRPNIRFYSEKDEGPFDAICRATQLARGEIMALICCSDGYLRDDWLELSMRVFDEDPDVSIDLLDDVGHTDGHDGRWQAFGSSFRVRSFSA